MMNRKTLALAAALSASTSFASHISGGEILYQCLGNNQYAITMNLFRDCVGIDMPTSDIITFNSPCGQVTLTVNLDNFVEVSQLCAEEIVNSTCNGGTLPGMQQYTYTGTVTLPPCDSWNMSWTSCCRNDAILNLQNPGSLNTYIEANMNNADFPCDDSPVFNNQPIPYVCLNQLVNYSFGVSDQDGDSLVYSFTPALEAQGQSVLYQGGFDYLNPLPGITIDPNSGLITFTPTQLGNFVLTVLVNEYDENGNLIGTVMRDIQFIVIPCTNEAPDPTTGLIAAFQGSATQTAPYGVEMCETDNFCFDFTISDPNAGDTLSLITNIAQVLPGATFSYTGANPVSGTICWTAAAGTGGFHSFIITAVDDACPVSAFQTYVYTVNVLERTSAGPDQTICGPQVAGLNANGGATFTWSVLSGEPIQLGVNFSCNPCEAPIADPSITTTYIVNSDLSGSCINSDTVTVFVVPDFTFQATSSDNGLCLGETVQFNVTVNPQAPGYVYEWTPSFGLNSTSIPNPVGGYNAPGTYDYTVDITSPDGCVHQDTTLTINVAPAFVPEFTISQLDDYICEGESTQLFVTLDNTLPAYCGLNYAGCTSGTITSTTVGPDSLFLDGYTYPSIYGQFYTGTRNQILFRASELQSLGFVGGTISEMAWEIANIPSGAATVYPDFTIKMGCTTQDSLVVGNWITGLSQVFSDTITIASGWNSYPFQVGFNWDGVSNLVIEVCWDFYVNGANYTLNSPTFYTNTNYPSVHQWHSDQGAICNDVPNGFVQESIETERPNTLFTYCSGTNPDIITYSWIPGTGVVPADSNSPIVTPTSSPMVYTVQVGDTASGCFGSADFTVNWYPGADVSFIPEPNEGVYPFTAFFNNTSASNVGNFTWTFGDGSDTAGVAEPNHTFNAPGVYYVTLTGTDDNGCYGTYTDSVVVLDQPIVVIPNVFSPNGDGNNDAFAFVDFRGFKTFSMKIFNRWGMLIKQTSSVQNQTEVWRPTKETPDGTYYYEFVGEGTNGDSITRTGHVTLLR